MSKSPNYLDPTCTRVHWENTPVNTLYQTNTKDVSVFFNSTFSKFSAAPLILTQAGCYPVWSALGRPICLWVYQESQLPLKSDLEKYFVEVRSRDVPTFRRRLVKKKAATGWSEDRYINFLLILSFLLYDIQQKSLICPQAAKTVGNREEDGRENENFEES